ncbi:hypothetical protein [Ammoniphilus sp. YIM 78166]|uniref:hypothetical protein n=1 Tax=Ammoniphilus sp. YIM 78166 TaxID=1644106 RepID=UPI00106F92D3|nr:hypothetical protein [Ammoniphilus sp. YIM 78166]
MSTNIPKSHLGPVRFPKHDTIPHGEVVVSQLPLDEVRVKYGVPPGEIFTLEKYQEFKKKGMTYRDMAEEMNLSYEAISYLASKYLKMVKGASK